MPTQIELPKAFKPIWETHRYKVFKGGRGSGKSESVARYLLTKGMERKRKIVCGREFQASIKESVYDMLVSFIDMYDLGSFYRVLKSEIIGNNGTTFSFVGLRHNIASIKSMYDVDIFWGEEAQTFSANSLTVLLPTVRAEGSELIFTMNPDLEEDPAYQMLVVDPPPDTVVTTVNYMDNNFFPDNLRALMEDQKAKDYQKYLNVWEGHCKAAVEGAIFAKEMEKAGAEGRIMKVPYDPAKPVDIFYDLGRNDKTAMWWVQQIGYEFRFLRYYENSGEHFSHFIKIAKELPYAYGRQYLPHDAENEQLSAEKTIKRQALDAFGSGVVVIPRIPKKALAIDAARGIFDRCVFDKELCVDGLTCLRKYAYKVDPETLKTSREPEHDTPWSHGADAFMAVGQSMLPAKKHQLPIKKHSIYAGI
jgi:phage terminase large subunit